MESGRLDGDEREMQLIERIEITKPMESKYIRADLLMNKIAESAFFSAAERARFGRQLRMNRQRM